jgi:AraC-like DNA-binding protein
MDKLSSLVGRHSFNARLFYNGAFCDTNQFTENGVSGQLHVVREGPVDFIHDDGEVITVTEPSLLFYPRGASHRLQVHPGHTANLLCAHIQFQDEMSNPLSRVLPNCLVMPLSEIAGLRSTLDLLFTEASQAEPGRDVILDRLCDVLLIQVIRREFDSGRLSLGLLAGLSDRQLSLALTAIHERPHEPWSLQSLAKVACMSRAAFTERFRDVMGMPPGEYLTRWRIGVGSRLLRQGMPVKQVSSRAGYTSPSTFTRAFTTMMGASPREWLKQAAG